jgi:hypothetical protein
MSFKHLFCAAAAAPLCFAALSTTALAQTNVTTATTAPLKTSVAGNVDVQAGGSIIPATTETLPGVTVDSNATVTVSNGSIIMRDQPASTGVLIQGAAGGRTFTFSQTGGTISADDSAGNTDTDGDGDLDGPFVAGGAASVRYGLHLTGPGVFTGNVTQTAGSITTEGNNGSAAVAIDGVLVGNINLIGSNSLLGSNSYGVHINGPVTGNVTIGGSISATGEGSIGVAIDNDITGALKFSGGIATTGFRYTNRPTDAAVVAKLDADDLLIGGPAVRISGNVTGGVRFQNTPVDASSTITDEDGDGVEDAVQTASSVTSYGSAPAVLIGGTGATTLGNVGTGAFAYGLMLQGSVAGYGLYDGVDSKGVVIGGQGGTVTTGAILVSGTISTSAIYANSTALQFGAGTIADSLKVTGSITAGVLGDATRHPVVQGILIDAGASLPTLVNTGAIRLGANGPEANLTTILDASGTLTSIDNQGAISAVIATGNVDVAPLGNQIALDLHVNTSGVTVLQRANLDPTITTVPSIVGDILFGSGNDTLQVDKGTVTGAVSFGAGSNTLSIASGAVVTGALSNTGGLQATVNGELRMTDGTAVAVTKLTTGAASTLGFTADQQNTGTGSLQVADTAVLGTNTKISLGFKSKLNVSSATPYASQDLILIHAANGLSGSYVADLSGELPYIYTGTISNTANDLVVSVQRRTAAQLGLQGSKAAAFDAFYSVFDSDATVAKQVFAQNTAAGFEGLYSQFLPDYSGGPFHAVAEASRAVARVQAEEPVDMVATGPRSWLQEIAFGIDHSSNTGQVVYDSAGFGLAGGVERAGPKNSTVGYSVAFATSDVDNSNRAFGSNLSASTIMGSLYWRKALRGVVFDASGTGGYAWFGGKRQILSNNAAGEQILNRLADAKWNGATAYLRVGATYEAQFGKFYVRPEAFVDYAYLYESGYTETGGGTAVNLTVDSRASSEAAAQAGIAIGGRFGRTFKWGPELSVAYRAHLAGNFGSTTAYFTSLPGQPFQLNALAADRSRLIVRAALRGSGAFANFSLEGSAEMGDVYDEYMGRLVVRFLF